MMIVAHSTSILFLSTGRDRKKVNPVLNNDNCIMPEMPYCPACEYGCIVPDEESDNTFTEWVCLYSPKELQKHAL